MYTLQRHTNFWPRYARQSQGKTKGPRKSMAQSWGDAHATEPDVPVPDLGVAEDPARGAQVHGRTAERPATHHPAILKIRGGANLVPREIPALSCIRARRINKYVSDISI